MPEANGPAVVRIDYRAALREGKGLLVGGPGCVRVSEGLQGDSQIVQDSGIVGLFPGNQLPAEFRLAPVAPLGHIGREAHCFEVGVLGRDDRDTDQHE